MARAQRPSGRPVVTVLVTDVDNTLYDWVAMWVPAFGAMLARLAAESGVPRERLEREFHALHRRYGTTEYAFAIQELPSLVALHPGEDLVARYAAAIDDYRTARRRTLRLYPAVEDTLAAIRARGCLVVGYTESRAYYANYRIRALGLDGLLDHVYSPPDHALPGGVSPERIRKYPAEHYRLARTVHRHTPEGAWKPDAALLRGILGELGADPSRTIYVGDSLVKDVAMARTAGVPDVFAKYGTVPDRAGYELLRRVTHWSSEMVERSERVRATDLAPTHVLEAGFAELLDLFDFHPFAPRPEGAAGRGRAIGKINQSRSAAGALLLKRIEWLDEEWHGTFLCPARRA